MSGLPVARNESTEEFFDGTARGEFLLLRCGEGHFSRPQAKVCDVCGGTELDAAPSSGNARLVSWVLVYRRGAEDQPPSVPAIVALEEGPWWWTEIVGADVAGLAEGLPLTVEFDRTGGGEAVPVFRPR